MHRLSGKTVIITGAAGGIGTAAVQLFSQEGANVVACDIVPVDENPHLPDVFRMQADLTQEAEAVEVVRKSRERFGRIDVLINNHGTMVGKPFLQTRMDEFDHVIDTNLRSTFWLCQLVGHEMVETGGGSIILLSSVGGLVGFPNMAAYSISKAGVAHLSRALARDLAEHNIRVNAICPGVIDTPQPRQYMENEQNKDQLWKQLEDLHLLKRVGTPEEVVWLAIFLASDESSFMTGAVIPVDGGMTAV